MNIMSSPDMSIFDMNTKAVLSMKAGRLQEGMGGLKDALNHAKALLMSYTETNNEAKPAPSSEQRTGNGMDMDCGNDASNVSSSNAIPRLSLFTVPLFTDGQTLAPRDAESAQCPFFDHAIVIGCEQDLADDNAAWIGDERCQNATLGVLLYNLALCYHLCAIRKGALAIDSNGAAVRLYQMVLSLFGPDADLDDHQGGCHNLTLLLCAVFNNKANIHSHFFHTQETQSCLDCLKELVDMRSENSIGCSQVEDDYLFFYLNLYVTAPTHAFPIAPAA